MLGDDAWELLRPDRPPPADRTAPGLSLRRVRELVDLRKDYEQHVGPILDAYWPHSAKVGTG